MHLRQRQRRTNEDESLHLAAPRLEVFDAVDKPLTTSFDAGVDLRDVQIAARHADPRTTMRYDRARKNLDRHPNYILAAYMASGSLTAAVSLAQPQGDQGSGVFRECPLLS